MKRAFAAVAATAMTVALACTLALAGSSDAVAASSKAPRAGAKHAPSGPPLSSGASQRESENAGVPSAAGDQLVENGLASPLCKGSTSGALSSDAESNCETSGFVGASAPTNNYAFDVHIDIGAFGLSRGGLLSVIQDVFIAPVWSALVWIVHALVVLLEWCFTLELLDSSTMGGLARSLRQAQASFTEPWLALVLAAASVLAIYNGLVRRRVTETLGKALTTFAMMAVGLWVIADPLGTVGAVGRWANQASLGTLGAVAQGTPLNASRTLADSMRVVFSGAIEMPWCYLEFGNVHWCSDPALLDPRLRKAALSLVTAQQTTLSCHASLGRGSCTPQGGASALAIKHSDELVREANTNGKLFLAFPANESQRNSVKQSSSLLHVLCQAEDDTKCTGPTAAEAEFRSDNGTFPRMIGVVLIGGGVLGMTMLFGLVALRLVSAAIVSLFLLLLAPFAVLAPALGDGGRAVFGGWATRLLGSVTSKLIFSFLLGALLSMQRILMSLELLGWWTQWLLISVFWWAVFFKRHQAMAFLQSRGHDPVARSRPSAARRIERAFETPRAALRTAGLAKRKLLSPVPDTELRKPAHRARAAGEMARERANEQVVRTLAHDHSAARARVQASAHARQRLTSKRAQLERVGRARQGALASGDSRRAALLAVREQRISTKVAREQKSFSEARGTVADGEAMRRTSGSPHTPEQRERRARFLDEQAALPSARERRDGAQRRDYAALAGLAGYGREDYQRLAPRARREACLRIDRELALRSQLGAAARDVNRASAPQLGRRERRRVDKEFDRALEQRTYASGSSLPGVLPKRSPSGSRANASVAEREAGDGHSARDRREAGGGRAAKLSATRAPFAQVGRPGGAAGERIGPRERKSRVMDDAREVAERRKRQLGYGPPR